MRFKAFTVLRILGFGSVDYTAGEADFHAKEETRNLANKETSTDQKINKGRHENRPYSCFRNRSN